jgi:hypothetical protein
LPRVFISYSHDSEEHKARVASLAQRLRAAGLNVVLDSDKLPGGPTEGWPLWSERQVKEADFVLVACTLVYSERYEGNQPPGVGLGAIWEAGAIRQFLYDHPAGNERIRVVLFDAADQQYIPTQLRRYHSYQPLVEDSYAELLGWLRPLDPASPVSASAPIKWPAAVPAYCSEIADRKDELELFEKMITGQSPKRILLLRGSSNSGKTVLLTALRDYSRHLKLHFAMLDFKGCPTLDQVFEFLSVDLGPQILRESYGANRNARFSKLITDLQQLAIPLVLLFDTYQEASEDSQNWLETHLLSRLDRLPGVVVVVGGQIVPQHEKHNWRGLVEACEMKPIRRVEDWLEFSDRKWQSPRIPTADIRTLTLATDGNPGQLSALLETLALKLQTDHGE